VPAATWIAFLSPIVHFHQPDAPKLKSNNVEILPWLQSVSAEEYWTQRRKQAEREEPRRWLRRLRRDPERAMTQVDEQFYQVVTELLRQRPPP